MISSVGWVRSGAARAEPIQDDEGDDGDERDMAENAAASAARRAARAQATGDDTELDETIARFGLDDYDDDDDPRDAGALPMFSRKALMFHRSNDDDPFVTLKDADDEDEDADDLIISPHDKLVLAARSEEDVSNIEVHVYEEEGHNLYPHHDILLPSFPLCLEWLGYRPHAAPSASTGANLVCVGTFEPQIEIWDLDVLNTFAPVAVLGGEYTRPLPPDMGAGGKKKKPKKKERERAGGAPDPALGHVDAVMALSWNPMQTNALASASADRTIRIWDLGSPGLACVQTLSHHADKVQAVRWHPSEPTVLLSGGFDKIAAVVDVRAQAAVRPFKLSADVESVSWLSDTHLLVSSEDGHVDCFDARADGRLWTLSAHDTAATGLSCNPGCAGMFATCSTDKVRAQGRVMGANCARAVWRLPSHCAERQRILDGLPPGERPRSTRLALSWSRVVRDARACALSLRGLPS
jgi:periodic tryptophan protein 1